MKCPTCLAPDLLMTDRLGIEVDYCPQCRGVWLDRGELDKIIERSMRDVPSMSAPITPAPVQQVPQSAPQYYSGHSGHQDKHGSYRKKSIWQELFD